MKAACAIPVDRIFRAFADPTRLRILSLLLRGELCVCDIVNTLEVPQPTASRHLAYLRKAGLVEARRDGLWMHYKLAPHRSPMHKKLIECLSCCFQDFPQLAKDAKQLNRRSKCCD
jgi:ArsR family transcriptional regulator